MFVWGRFSGDSGDFQGRGGEGALSTIGRNSSGGFEAHPGKAVARYKKAQEFQRSFDIVILDLIVPGGIGGEEVLEKLREISPGVKAIVASGYSNNPIFSGFKQYGFKGVLAKPFDLEGLSESVS